MMIKGILAVLGLGICCFTSLFIVTLVLGGIFESILGNGDIVINAWIISLVLLSACLACLLARGFFIW